MRLCAWLAESAEERRDGSLGSPATIHKVRIPDGTLNLGFHIGFPLVSHQRSASDAHAPFARLRLKISRQSFPLFLIVDRVGINEAEGDIYARDFTQAVFERRPANLCRFCDCGDCGKGVAFDVLQDCFQLCPTDCGFCFHNGEFKQNLPPCKKILNKFFGPAILSICLRIPSFPLIQFGPALLPESPPRPRLPINAK
jgi:hypothetical protein